jgi:4-alpha-glucanotransferase
MHNERSAGILLHISSLPGPFCIGDLGPEAYKFAGQLAESAQRYWLILPLNPVQEPDFSPYSCIGSMAGNILLISPEKLLDEGLLTADKLTSFKNDSTDKVDYIKAAVIKTALLNTAYESFLQQPDHAYYRAFAAYCEEQSGWLNDYTTYRVLCAHYNNKPWQQWSKDHCNRNCTLTNEQQDLLQK